jgi:hypothetical protein
MTLMCSETVDSIPAGQALPQHMLCAASRPAPAAVPSTAEVRLAAVLQRMVTGAKRSMRSTRRGGGTAEFYELDRDNLARIKVPKTLFCTSLFRTGTSCLSPSP